MTNQKKMLSTYWKNGQQTFKFITQTMGVKAWIGKEENFMVNIENQVVYGNFIIFLLISFLHIQEFF